MSSVGAYLRGLREQQGLSVDELSRATRVLHHYLEALEADNVRGLPAPVFTKGFIRAYCQAVGVPAEEALRLYDKMGVPPPDLSKPPVNAARPASATDMPRRPFIQEPDYLPVTPSGPPLQGEASEARGGRGTLLISFVLLVILGAAFFAVTLALQSGREGDGEQSAQAQLPPMAPVPEPVAASAPTAFEPVPPQPAAPSQFVKQSQAVAPSASTAGTPVPTASHAPSASPGPVAAPAPRVSSTPTPSGSAPGAAASPSVSGASTAPATSSALPPRVPTAPSAPGSPGAAVASKPQAAPSVAMAPPDSARVPPAAAAPGMRGLATPYRLVARTTQITWMRVRTEDGRTSEETIPANEVREWVSNGPFVITIGNAGGVSLELNGRPVPRLGASGSVVTRLVLPSDDQ